MSHVYRMSVRKYLPEKLYGFASCDQGDVFFHLSTFIHPNNLEDPPPPIVGEYVDVDLKGPLTFESTPKAQKVTRLSNFNRLNGSVLFFNVEGGYGKIKSESCEYFLHRSEVREGKLPMRGDLVSFFAVTSVEERRSRACHVKIEGKL